MTEAAEFWALVESGPGCWRWLGAVDKDGYGFPWWHGRRERAHRIAYQLVHGPIPATLQVCHHCDVPGCVNPDHLWVGTNTENQADCTAKGRRPTGARNGHATTPEAWPRGERHWKARLTQADVEAIRAGVAAGTPARMLAQSFGVSRTHIYRILRRQAWS